jgi:ribosome-associated toxin RatA of RatAB toxin-antitoxin module
LVYTREAPDTEIKEVKAEGLIEASASRIWKVLLDFNHYKEFMPYTTESEVTHEEENVVYFYTHLEFGLCIGDRYYTIRLTKKPATEKDKTYKLSWDLADKFTKKPDGEAIAVPLNKGYWELRPEGKAKTKVMYYLYTDPGGEVPSFIANFANRDAVPKIIKAVQARLKNKKYDD